MADKLVDYEVTLLDGTKILYTRVASATLTSIKRFATLEWSDGTFIVYHWKNIVSIKRVTPK